MELQLASNMIERYLRTGELLGPQSPVDRGGPFGQSTFVPNIFFVDPTNGNDGNNGRDPRDPLVTIQAAIDLCVTQRGDIIIVSRGGHTVSSAITCDKRGVTIMTDSYGVNAQNTDEHWIIAAAGYTTGPVVEIEQGCRWVGFNFESRFTTGPSVRATNDSNAGTNAFYTELVECSFHGWGIGYDGFEMRGASLCAVRRCTFDAIANSGAGIAFRGSATNNPVRNVIEECIFTNCTAGIAVRSATPQDNFIHKCRFKDCTDDINTNGGAGDAFVTENWHEGSAANAHDDSVTNLVSAGWTFAGNHYGES